MELLLNEVSEGDLIPESDSNESSDNEWPYSPNVAMKNEVN
jgi:hypothetical protein